jgi:hypothetical protein
MRKGKMVLAALGLLMVGVLAVAQTSAKPATGQQFLIMVYETPEEYKLRTDKTERGQNYWKEWGGYHAALQEAGVLRGGLPMLEQSTAKTVKLQDGKRVVKDGPVTATQPIWTGFFIIEVENMEQALNWAAKVPNVSQCHVEVRVGDPLAVPAAKK